MPAAGAASPNLFEMVPDRVHEWAEDAEGKIRVLVPRYGKSAVGRWFASLMGRPHIEVRLDDIGSAIWRACDGGTPVVDIAHRIEKRFGAMVDPVEDRLARYLRQLERGGLVRLRGGR